MKILWALVIFGITYSMAGMSQDQGLTSPLILNEGTEPLWTLRYIKGNVDNPSLRDRIRVYIYNKKNPVYLFEFIAEDLSFLNSSVPPKVIRLSKYPRPLLVTDWIRGARTPCLRIFDPSLGKTAKLAEYCSLDLKYEVKDDHIDIAEFMYKNTIDSTLIEMKTEWSPIELPKGALPDNPSVPQNQ